ncbi:hypothetical protein D9V84_05605 [Bacteroidetes/Chlorobi group bacterium Naka2016]|nr:MAG: hypothetical protein D9V84_05605 [Bacteroidetes/Chlorobi group bacterium Naka2016]
MPKNILFWVLSLLIMLGLAIYQRTTGPTYPKTGSFKIEGQKIKYKLVRSWGENSDAFVKIVVPNANVSGFMKFRRHPSYDDWSSKELIRSKDTLIAVIPQQPPAGKIMYQIFLNDDKGNEYKIPPDEPVIIRFKGSVPDFVLIPHIFFMFFSMVFGIRVFFEALVLKRDVYKLSLWTFVLLFIGGAILGPIVQHYAFGVYWSGWPFGHDLTDNKTLISLIFWLIAIWRLKKNPTDYKWAIIASIVMVAVYLIPHSVLGSEIDYTKIPK